MEDGRGAGIEPNAAALGVLPTPLGDNTGVAGTSDGVAATNVGGNPGNGGGVARGSEPASTSGREDPTSPVNSSLQVTTPLDRLGLFLDIWKQNLFHCAVSKNVMECLKTSMPGTNLKGDAAALHLLLQRIPEVWAQKVAFAVSAAVALKWIISQFEGGANLDINDQWIDLLDNEVMGNEGTLEEFVSRKELLARRLNANNMAVTTAKLKKSILKCLQWQFEPHKPSLASSTATCDVTQTLAAIKVVAATIGFNDQQPRAPRAAVVRKPGSAGGQDTRECYHCGEVGHIKRFCPKLNSQPKKGNPPASDERNARAGMASAHLQCAGEGQWIVDTGATNHICNDLRLMSNVIVYDEAKPLSLAASDGQAMRKAQGNVCLTVEGGGSVLLTQVEYVPTATDNLLSVSAAVKDGCTFAVNNKGEYVSVSYQVNEFVCDIESKGRLYFLSHKNGLCAWGGAAAMLVTTREETELWHKRLGHPGVVCMSRMLRENLIDNVKGSLSEVERVVTHCDGCIRGKQTRTPSPPSTAAESTERLQLVHMDVVGELPVAGLNGEKYMLVLVDDFSRRIQIRTFCSKVEVGALVQEVLLNWEVSTGCKVVTVRTDRGTEFVNYDLTNFFARKGITHQTSAPYTPQQNGKVERINRVIKERVRALLFEAEAGPELWPEAARTVVRLLNYSAVSGKTLCPQELFYGRKPSGDHLRVWGCLAYVKLPDRQLSALGPRSVAGMFVGYESGSKAYRVLVKGKVVVSEDVRFVEDELGYPVVLPPSPHLDIGVEGLFHDDEEVSDEVLEKVIETPREIAADPEMQAGNLQEILLRARGVLQQLPPEPQGHEDAEEENLDEEREGNEDPGHVEEREEGQSEPEEEEGRGRGGGRYDLRERVGPPDKYVPGAYHTHVEVHAAVLEDVKMKASELSVPKHIGEALASPQKEYWKQAMQEELDAIEECDTYEVVRRPEGAKVIPLIWVYALKTDEYGDVIRFKARLVAQGCKQVEGVDCDQTFAPVSTHACRRVLLNIAATENLEIHQVDIKTAFLNGELEEEVYVTQPPGFSNGDKEVFRLKKALCSDCRIADPESVPL
jgi:transposase InsO family protein